MQDEERTRQSKHKRGKQSHIMKTGKHSGSRAEQIYLDNNQHRQLLHTVMDGYILADTNGNVIDVNPAYCHMVGYSREELFQINIRELEAMLSPEAIKQKIKQMVEQGGATFETSISPE